MDKIFKRIIGIVMCLCLIVYGLKYLTDLTERKSSDYKYIPFFEHSKDYDVLYIGTSHVINAFFPMELWKDYGITAYNFGGHANTMAVNYWVMMNALEYSDPKLIIIDCLGASSGGKASSDYFEYVHLSMDAFPYSKVKEDAINDLFEDNESLQERSKADLRWDFSVYHNRWTELSKDDFNQSSTQEYGAESRINVSASEKITKTKEKFNILETTGGKYLDMMVSECKKRGIEVLLTYLPFPASEGHYKEANGVKYLAEKRGVNYINFLDMGIVNYNTDCYDPNSHVNPSGARKVTSYLGQYLKDNYKLRDHRNGKKYAYWNNDYYDGYVSFKINNIKTQTSLKNYLMLLADKKLSCCMYVKDGTKLLDNETIRQLIKNISQYKNVERLDEAANAGSRYFLLVDNGSSDIKELVGKEELNGFDTSFGSLSYSGNETSFLNIQGSENNYLVHSEDTDNEPDIQIVVVSQSSRNIEDVATFSLPNTSGMEAVKNSSN